MDFRSLLEGPIRYLVIRVVLGFVVFFLMTFCFAFSELRYLILGRTTQADLTKVTTEENRPPNGELTTIEYKYTERGGNERTGSDEAKSNDIFRVGASNKMKVRYISGENGDSRIDRGTDWIPVGALLGLLVLIVGGFCLYASMSYAAAHPVKKRKRKKTNRRDEEPDDDEYVSDRI